MLINVIINWYENLHVVVRWDGYCSMSLKVTSGVRQGGVLSPVLFNIYVDCLISELRKLGLGCYMHGVYIGCIM